MTLEERRQYHRDRRALAKSLGICCQCNCDDAKPGLTKCAGCIKANATARKYPSARIQELIAA